MAGSGAALTLLVPGLLGPVSGVPRQYLAAEQAWPGLTRLLEHSQDDAWPQAVPELALAELFGKTKPTTTPQTTHNNQNNNNKPPPNAVLRADPVHLRASAQ